MAVAAHVYSIGTHTIVIQHNYEGSMAIRNVVGVLQLITSTETDES